MRMAEIVLGGIYAAKISGRMVWVQINLHSIYGGWSATNLKTGRKIHIKTAAKLRYPIPKSAQNRQKRRERRDKIKGNET